MFQYPINWFERFKKNKSLNCFQLVKCEYLCSFHPPLTITLVSLGCEQNKTFKDDLFGFRKHWLTCFRFLNDEKQLIKKAINRLINNETFIICSPRVLKLTLAMTSGSGSSIGSAHSTVTTLPQTFTLPLISRRRAWAAVLWSSYSRKQKPLFFFLSSGWWYRMTSLRPSVSTQK